MATPLTSIDFIQKFHEITGTSIGERRKNLFLLLRQASANKLIIDFAQIQPKTPLEENFKLETLVYFNNTEQLFAALTSENPIIVHQVVKKASPSLVRALCSITNQQLLNLLGKICLNAKLKLLNKCGQYLDNSQKAEEFFGAIQSKYGVHLASKLITACSSAFLIHFIQNNRFKFTPQQLMIIYKRHPNIIQQVFEILRKHVDVVQEYRSLLKYISRHDVVLLLNLRKVYNFDMFSIGRRATNTLIQHDKSNIIKNAKSYADVLQSKYITKSLRGDDFNLFYYNLFPPLITQFDKSYEQILELTPNVEFLLTGFSRMYNIELWNESKFVTPKILELMQNEDRLKVIKPEYKPTNFTDEDWACYLNSADSLSLLKKRVFLTSDIQSRAKLIYLLVETCRINKDETTLLDICNYMIKQHRNDHISVRLSFLKAVKKGFKLDNLEMTHWGPINELLQIFVLNGEDLFHIEEFMIAFIKCSLRNKQPIKEPLIVCLKRRSIWSSWNLLTENPVFEMICIQTIPSILPELGTDLANHSVSYLAALVNWNVRHPKDELPLFDDTKYMEYLVEILKEKEPRNQRNLDLVMLYILHKKIIPQRSFLLELYIPKMDLCKISWLVHNDINVFLQNFEGYVNIALKNCIATDSLWLYCRLYGHLNVPQKIIDICLHILSQELPKADKAIKNNALTALSYLMQPANVLELKYSITRYMKNIIPKSVLVETVLKYCCTNQVSAVKRAVFSLMNKLVEPTIKKCMLQLMDSDSINAHKISIYMLFRTMDDDTIMDILRELLKDSRIAPLNKYILKTVFKYFVKNPNDYIWEIIELTVTALDFDDREAYNFIVQPDKIPREYLARYILFVWKIVESVPDFYTDYAIKLLGGAEPSLLPPEFCNDLIETYFFRYTKNYTDFYIALQVIVCKYICCSEEKLFECVSRMYAVSNTATNFKIRGYIDHFVKQLCYQCVKENKKDVLVAFSNQWNALLKPYEMFQQYLYIQFSLIKLENITIPDIAGRLSTVCILLTDKYGIEFLHPFSQELKRFLEMYVVKAANAEETEVNWYMLVENVVKHDRLALILLAILLLEGHQPTFIETQRKHDELIGTFEKRPELEVSIYLNDLNK